MSKRINIALSCLVLLILIVGLGFAFVVFPYVRDDYGYMRMVLDITENSTGSFSLQKFIEFLRWRYLYDSLRLSNITGAFALALPKWINGSLSAIFFAYAAWLMSKIWGVRNRQWRALVLCIFLLMALLPWWQMSLSFMYQINYMWASAIAATAMWLFLRPKRLNVITAVTVGVILGWWHEGFAFPTIVGLATAWMCFRECRAIGQTVMLGSMMVVLGLSCFVPGAFWRISYQSVLQHDIHVIRTIYTLIPVYVFIILSLWAMRWQKIWKSPVWVTFMGICLTGVLMKCFLSDSRAIWWPCMAACIGSAALLARLTKLSLPTKNVIAVVLMVILCLHFVAADCIIFKERKDFDTIVEYEKANLPYPYLVDISVPVRRPLIAWGLYDNFLTWPDYAYYYGIDDKNLIHAASIVPRELLSFTPTVASDSLSCGWWVTESGRFVAPHDTTKGLNATYKWVYLESPLVTEQVLIRIFPFVSQKDGKPYDYIHVANPLPWQRPITGIKEYQKHKE